MASGQGDLPDVAMKKISVLLFAVLSLASCKGVDKPIPNALVLWCTIDGQTVRSGGNVFMDCSPESMTVVFSKDVDARKKAGNMFLLTPSLPYKIVQGPDSKSITLQFEGSLGSYKKYTLYVTSTEGFGVKTTSNYSFSFTTPYDTTDKFPRITTDSLLTLVQKRTFNYFWDGAHPTSGLALERQGSGATATTGGSGFGLMAIIAAVKRGFISRADAYARVLKITDFLASAESFHGVFPHWMNGSTGAAIPFSTYDDGADLVETSFLMEGLLACRNYFSGPGEAELRNKITALWEAVGLVPARRQALLALVA